MTSCVYLLFFIFALIFPVTKNYRYEFGDISTFVYESIQQRKENEAKASEDGSVGIEKSILEESRDRETILKELEEWDKKFLIQGSNSTKLE